MLIYVLAILLGITGFTWGFGYVDLTTQAEPAETLQMSLTRQTLIQQGFPEDALNQIQEGDLQGIKDVKGVYILYGNSIKFVEIVPLYSSNNYVICDPDPDTSELMTSETLTLYDEVVVGGKDLYDGKMVK